MIRYVLGFLFTPDEERVVLLHKTHGPAGMTGKLNGVGGKIEAGESAVAAMAREGREEIGLDGVEWQSFGTMRGGDWSCELFRAHDARAFEARGMEDECVWLADPNELPIHAMPNLSWLIPLAQDPEAAAIVLYGSASGNDDLVILPGRRPFSVEFADREDDGSASRVLGSSGR